MPIVEDEAGLAILVKSLHRVAVIGMKGDDRPEESAHEIPALMQRLGIEIVPVNPGLTQALGQTAYPRLADVPGRVDCVDVFRRISAIPGIAEEILALPAERRPHGVWLQSGIRHDEAAMALSTAGMWVVQDRCLGVYARRYRR
jgi:uncharacterized protein